MLEEFQERHSPSTNNGYRPPQSIAYTMQQIRSRKYVLPGIQRRYTWDMHRVEKLFDSIMEDYPINTIMLWFVHDDSIKQNYAFYDFLLRYQERYATVNQKIDMRGPTDFYAVIDGQQRLNSLYIGLYGTYAAHRKWRGYDNTPENYPPCRLYLDLLNEVEEDSDLKNPFKFLPDKDAIQNLPDSWWFPVGEILNLDTEDAVEDYLYANINGKGLNRETERLAAHRLRALRKNIIERKLITAYVQEDQDQDRVLEIFTRTNSGGVSLSKSDLIMAIAAANWPDIRDKTDELIERIRQESNFTRIDKDHILRTFLVCWGPDVTFKVENFGKPQVDQLRSHWKDLSEAIVNTFRFLRNQGYNDHSLRATNAAIPITYYLLITNQVKQAGLDIFGTKPQTAEHDVADTMLRWLNMSLLKGTFGGQSDTLLRGLRDCIREYSRPNHFPLPEIREKFRGSRNDITFSPDMIDTVLQSKYGSYEADYVLRILQGIGNPEQRAEQDHLHPKTSFTPKNKESHDQFSKRMKQVFPNTEDRIFALDESNWNRLPNLQLLEKRRNINKSDKSLEDWANEYGLTSADLLMPPGVSLAVKDFPAFIKTRREALRDKLTELLS